MHTIFHQAAAELVAQVLTDAADAILPMLAPPPKAGMGDLGFPCFALAKARRLPPPAVANDLAAKLCALPAFGASPFESIVAVGPYVNFRYRMEALARHTAQAALASPETWGVGNEGQGKTVVIDYSGPNIGKPLGVHHIRSTMIGAALARLYAARGWKVVTINHLGDWGTTFGQLMVSYERAERESPGQPVDVNALLALYVKFHADAEENESLDDDARTWFKKLEDGDPRAKAMWKLFRDSSLAALEKLYARLGVRFDHYTGESFFIDHMPEVVARLRQSGVLTESNGAQVVDLSDQGMPPCLVIKSDGATTYPTRDLAAAWHRHGIFGFDKCLYVVANQQELHFRQVFAVLARSGCEWAAGCEHVKFGMMSFGPGVFGDSGQTGSTRRGRVIRLESVLDEAVAEALRLIGASNREGELPIDADRLSGMIGVGAVIFQEFTQRRTKDFTFTWERALNLHGDSGPYLQYTHARLSSARRKWTGSLDGPIPWDRLRTDLERDVLLGLLEWNLTVAEATRENEPSLIATHLLSLAASFNRLFTDKEEHRLISDDESLTRARMALAEAVRLTLSSGLAFLGLGAPERM